MHRCRPFLVRLARQPPACHQPPRSCSAWVRHRRARSDPGATSGPRSARRRRQPRAATTDQFLLQVFDKCHVIGNRRARKQVKRTRRPGEFIAGIGKPVAKQIPFALVLADIHAHPLHAGNHPLHQSGCIDKSQNPVGQRHAGHQFLFMGGGGIHRGKTDAFARNGNVLGIGGSNNAFTITLENGRHRGIVEDDFPVGFI